VSFWNGLMNSQKPKGNPLLAGLLLSNLDSSAQRRGGAKRRGGQFGGKVAPV